MTGSNHHLAQRIQRKKPCSVNGEKAVAIGNKLNFPFFRLRSVHIGPQGQVTQHSGTFVLMQHSFIGFPNIHILFTHRKKDRNILCRNNMALTEDRPLCHPANDLCNIMTQNLPYRIFRFNTFHKYIPFSCREISVYVITGSRRNMPEPVSLLIIIEYFFAKFQLLRITARDRFT